MDSVLFKVLITVIALSVLVIIHEGGHYLAARAFGMRVLRYSIGFGPTLFRYQPKGSPTVFQVAVIPFLAYVQIAGMNPHEEVDPDDPEIFPNKSLFARIATIAAGPIANYGAASLLIFIIAVITTGCDWFIVTLYLARSSAARPLADFPSLQALRSKPARLPA